jgi:hybrid cluster-associated redox disulfide protein
LVLKGETVKHPVQQSGQASGTTAEQSYQRSAISRQLIEDRTVADVLSRWPQTVPVFLRYRLACIGCSLSRFEQIADVVRTYDLDRNRFLAELRQAIESYNPKSEIREEY